MRQHKHVDANTVYERKPSAFDALSYFIITAAATVPFRAPAVGGAGSPPCPPLNFFKIIKKIVAFLRKIYYIIYMGREEKILKNTEKK